MFENIGGKIKTTAAAISWIGIVANVFLGFIIMGIAEEMVIFALLYMAVGSLVSWISSFILYGFGQLVENTDKLCADIKAKEKSNADNVEAEQVQNV